MVSPTRVTRNRRRQRPVSQGVPRVLGACLAAILATLVASPGVLHAADEPLRSSDEQVAFLKSAKVIQSRPIGKGVTGALRLTLTDGRLTHDAAFQSVDQRSTAQDLREGNRRAGELMFVDSFRYNIAAWQMARLLGLAQMMPATIERRHEGKVGALSWWVDDVLMDEAERLRTSPSMPPGAALPLVQQRHLMQVFAELVHDTDRNQGNVVYTNDWRLVMLDFTRAFRTQNALRQPGNLVMIDRELLARLRSLTKKDASKAVGSQLTPFEIDAMLKRRDLIVTHFDRLVAERGEAAVLF
jgi:hypothetical protein